MYNESILSHFSHVQLFETLWTIACQAPLFMGFSRQEYWTEFPCSPPRDLPDPRIEPASPVSPALQADSLPNELPGKPISSVQFSRCRVRLFATLWTVA